MKSLTILVADDDPQIREAIKYLLAKAGHAVTCAATGEGALKLLKEQQFDLLVTDVLMPDGDGLSVIMGVRQANLPIRILVISGGGKYFHADNCVRLAETLGAHAALFKPFTPPDLLDAVNRAVGGTSSPT